MSVCACVCGCNYDLEGYAPNEEVCGACLSVCREEVKEGEKVKNYKCTDCHKFYNIDKGTYDEEWGFHCIYCGGLEELL
jgi:hypothetical protein